MMRLALVAMLLAAGPVWAQDAPDDEQQDGQAVEQRHDDPPPLAATLGFYEGERDNGGNKVCIYNKFGQTSVITVPLVSACPR